MVFRQEKGKLPLLNKILTDLGTNIFAIHRNCLNYIYFRNILDRDFPQRGFLGSPESVTDSTTPKRAKNIFNFSNPKKKINRMCTGCYEMVAKPPPPPHNSGLR